ncbi:MAG: GNAT family N-acetyltransferase [Ginsengibacter sp.]
MISIVHAGPEDIQTIQNLARKIWPATYAEILSSDQLEYMLRLIYSHKALTAQMIEADHVFYLAIKDEEPVGFISLAKNSDDPTIFELNKIYVLPEMQGAGIGLTLLDFAKNAAIEKGGKTLQLNVNRNNKAVHFYRKNGFDILREEDINIGKGYFMNDYVMSTEV